MNFPCSTQIPTENPVSTPYTFTAFAPPSFPSRSDNCAHRCTRKGKCRCPRQLITFDILPDDVLLEIFDLYVQECSYDKLSQSMEDVWIRLAHVCRRWRSVVFQSPLRLDLRLVCTPQTPTRDMLDIWPPLPLIVRDIYDHNYRPLIEDNIIAALEHNDRVQGINLIFSDSELEYFADSEAILKPFPELIFLRLNGSYPHEEPERLLPESFLGGSAPNLRFLELEGVPLPGLPNLLLSTTHLRRLHLYYTSYSGYIPPEVMATSISALTSLDCFRLQFYFPPPRPALEVRRPPRPPLTRSILPGLKEITFSGTSEYLEVILARIDAPRLDKLDITFFNQMIFDTPQLFQFISRKPTMKAPEVCDIRFNSSSIAIKFTSKSYDFDIFKVQILCTTSEWQLSSLEQVFTSSLPPVSTSEDLYIFETVNDKPHWQDDVESTLWLDALRSFVAVKDLYISEEFVPRIAPALQELVGGRTTEVLPSLENIFLDGLQSSRPLQEGIEKFVAARLVTSRPVAVSLWDRN